MTTPRDECEECEATAAEVRALGHRPGCRHEVLQTGGAQPLSVSFQSFDTPEGGVSMDLGVIESPDPLANLRVLLDAKLAPKVTPTGGHLAGCTCEVVALWHDEVCPVELRAPDGTLHRYAVEALFGAKDPTNPSENG